MAPMSAVEIHGPGQVAQAFFDDAEGTFGEAGAEEWMAFSATPRATSSA
jgi:hypothetical protein